MIKFGIIGAGWRSEFYLRIAALLPHLFSVSGIYIRNPEKRGEFTHKYNVTVFDSLDKLLKTEFDFLVSCVNKASISDEAQMLAEKGYAVLTETPVARKGLEGKLQVAEQFHFMPRNQAYKRIIDSGILGEVHQVQLSCCHDYHAASLIRFFLGITDETPTKTTVTLPDRLIRYNGRNGIQSPVETNSEQRITILDFGTKSAVYDFNSEQYFSDIRASQIVIRGTKGEIVNNLCTYLKNGTPHSFEIKRNFAGSEESLDGFCLKNITGGGELLFENPFKGARLSDEEIAIATCLVKMKEFCDTATPFYSAEEAYLDYKLIP